MPEAIEWTKVKAWLTRKGAEVTGEQSMTGDDGGDVWVYEVTREQGGVRHKTVINAASFTSEGSADRTVLHRTPPAVAAGSVAGAAAALRISDASEVLGRNWKERFPEQARAEEANERNDARFSKVHRDQRQRSGSLPGERPGEGTGEEGKEEGKEEGEVR